MATDTAVACQQGPCHTFHDRGRNAREASELRRIIQLMLLTLALVCLAPAAIGRLAESRQQFLVDSLAHSVAGADLITEQYETGWITSRSIHRLRLDDPAYINAARELTGIPNLDESPELVIRSRIAHGPWPLLQGRPGLARVHSEVTFVVGQDEISIPGVAIADIGLDGSGVTVFDSPGMETTVESGSAFIRWHATDLRISFDRQVRNLDSLGTIGELELLGSHGEIRFGPIRVDGRSAYTTHGFWSGESRLNVARFSTTGIDGASFLAEGIELDLAVLPDGDLVNHRYEVTLDRFSSPRVDAGQLQLAGTIENLDAAALGRLLAERTGGRWSSDRQSWTGVFSAASRFHLREFLVEADGERARLEFECHLRDAIGAETDPGELLRALQGQGTILLSEGLLPMLIGNGNDPAAVESLLAIGYLRRVEGGLLAELRLGGGLLTINGLPIPLPMPAD